MKLDFWKTRDLRHFDPSFDGEKSHSFEDD